MLQPTILVLTIAAALAAPVSAQPRAQGNTQEKQATVPDRVLDEAEVFSDNFETGLNARLQDIEFRKGLYIVVMSAGTLGGTDPDSFADSMFDRWESTEIDSPQRVLLLLAPNDRAFTVALRSTIDMQNLEGRPDAYWFEKGTLPPSFIQRIKSIVEAAVVPHFKKGDWEAGLDKGIGAIEDAVRDLTEDNDPIKKSEDT